MKRFLIILTVLATFSSLKAAPNSYVSTDRWYVAGALGVAIPTDDETSSSIGSAKLNSDPGLNVVMAGGYEWDGKRMEIEYSHRRAEGEMSSSNALLDNQNADLVFNSLMINFLYDFPLSDRLYWSNGIGVGVVWVNYEALNNDDTDAQLGWQLITGLGYKITRELSLTATYRLHTTRNSSFGLADTQFDVDTPYLSALEIGLRCNF